MSLFKKLLAALCSSGKVTPKEDSYYEMGDLFALHMGS
jgi:hypothetical protein